MFEGKCWSKWDSLVLVIGKGCGGLNKEVILYI